jgi:hypothetical protein
MAWMWRCRATERIRRVMKRMPRASSWPSTSWVVTRWSRARLAGSAPDSSRQWSQKASTSRAWLALETSALA